MGIVADREVKPTVGGPLVRCIRKLDFCVDVSVHPVRVRSRDIVLNNDLRIRIDFLDTTNEAYCLDGIFFGVLGITNYKRELRYDPVFAYLASKLQGLLG